MIGLVNAIGTADTAQVQGQFRANETNRQQEQSKIAPLLTNEAAASKVLKTGIQTLDESADSMGDRATPGEGQSDRYQQADAEAKPGLIPGNQLDLFA